MRLTPDYKDDPMVNSENLLYLTFSQDLSAFDISRVLSHYGDVFVMKDSRFGSFIEFHHFDERYEMCDEFEGIQEIRKLMVKENRFGKGVLTGIYGYYESLPIRRAIEIE